MNNQEAQQMWNQNSTRTTADRVDLYNNNEEYLCGLGDDKKEYKFSNTLKSVYFDIYEMGLNPRKINIDKVAAIIDHELNTCDYTTYKNMLDNLK